LRSPPELGAGRLGAGVGYALAAGLSWGLVFIAPVLLPDYSPAMLSFGRYLAFGVIALPLAWFARKSLASLTRADWREAMRLALVGNIVYYLCLSAGIQAAGVPLPTMLIGTLPVVIAIASNLSERTIAWARLAPSLAIIAVGVTAVNLSEIAQIDPGQSRSRYALGAALTLLAVAAWTWYPIRNARWLQRNQQHGSGTWATAQGIATLPLAAIGYLGWVLWQAWSAGSTTAATALTQPTAWLGPEPVRFVLLMFAIGLSASWLGTLLWNRASQLLPTTLAGQLIVFETLAALTYGYLHRGRWPDAVSGAGIALLVFGVVLATRSFQRQVEPTTERA
jgi:drug/metabolite transporter (DMT)-like permease